MEVWIALVGGIIIGWVAEWIIDWVYWRRSIKEFYANESELRSALSQVQEQERTATEDAGRLRRERDDLRDKADEIDQADAALRSRIQESQNRLDAAIVSQTDLRARLEAAEQENRALKEQLAVASEGALARQRDDLERIDGIGPIYEQKLFDAGIETYSHLAAATSDELRDIIQPAAWQNLDFEQWIEEGRRFAAVVMVDQMPYRLEEIRGIGPTYARRLNEAGITSFAQLAAAKESDLRDIIDPARWQAVDFKGWIRQARAFDALVSGDRPPLPLEKIKGIGPVSATRLDLAGIKTLAQLAQTSPDRLQEIIGMKTDAYQDWIEQASAFVSEEGEPTETLSEVH